MTDVSDGARRVKCPDLAKRPEESLQRSAALWQDSSTEIGRRGCENGLGCIQPLEGPLFPLRAAKP